MSTIWGAFEGIYLSADKAINQDRHIYNFCRTKKGVGEFWTAEFEGEVKEVTEVRILNR